MATKNFTGLTMPVFTAFGWAGEEAALEFAYEQLEAFIAQLHANLPRQVQTELPFFGLSREAQAVYLASDEEDIESDVHIAFYARPMSLEMQLAVVDEKVLSKGLKKITDDIITAHHSIAGLGPEWKLLVQQKELDESSGEAANYQDLFNNDMSHLDEETAKTVFEKAAYLNSQEKWVTPVYISKRFSSERLSAMGTAVLDVMSEEIKNLLPVLRLVSGRTKKRLRTKSKQVKQPVRSPLPDTTERTEGEFTYVAELKPLHLRRGFVNMTPRHWPFFAITARTETRDVSVYYEGLYDKESSVWRLKSNDMARLVLGPNAREWLQDHFAPDDKIQIRARRLSDDEIQIALTPVHEE